MMLRGWNDADVDAWAAMNADPRVMEFFPAPYGREQSLSSARALREELERNRYGWLIAEVKGGMSFAGAVALQEVPFRAHFTPAMEIGWRFVPEAWGHGYATEAASALLHYAFTELGRSEVVAMTAEINAPSRRVMERLHMTHDAADDFDHPRLSVGDRLRRHVLYRARAKNGGR